MAKIVCPSPSNPSYKTALERAGGSHEIVHLAYFRNKNRYQGIEAKIDEIKAAQPTKESAAAEGPVMETERDEYLDDLDMGLDAQQVPVDTTIVTAVEPRSAAELQAEDAKLAEIADRLGRQESFSAVGPDTIETANLLLLESRIYYHRFVNPDDKTHWMDQVTQGLLHQMFWSPDRVIKFLREAQAARKAIANGELVGSSDALPRVTDEDSENEGEEDGEDERDDNESGKLTKEDYSDDAQIRIVEGQPLNKLFTSVIGGRSLTDSLTLVRRASLELKAAYPDTPDNQLEDSILSGDVRGIPSAEEMARWARSVPPGFKNNHLRMFRSFLVSLLDVEGGKPVGNRKALQFLRSVSGYGVDGLFEIDDLETVKGVGAVGVIRAATNIYDPSAVTATLADSAVANLSTESGKAALEELFNEIYEVVDGRLQFRDRAPELTGTTERALATRAMYEGIDRAAAGYRGTEAMRFPYRAAGHYSNDGVKGQARWNQQMAKATESRALMWAEKADAARGAGNAAKAAEYMEKAAKAVAKAKEAAARSRPVVVEQERLGRVTRILNTIFADARLDQWLRDSRRVTISRASGRRQQAEHLLNDLVGYATDKGAGAQMAAGLVPRLREAVNAGADPETIKQIINSALLDRKVGKPSAEGKPTMGGAGDKTAFEQFLSSGIGSSPAVKHIGPTGKTERTSSYDSTLSTHLRQKYMEYFMTREEDPVTKEEFDLGYVERVTPDGVSITMRPAGASTDKGAEGLSYAVSGKEVPAETIAATLAAAYDQVLSPTRTNENGEEIPVKPRSVHPEYSSFWIDTLAKSSLVINVPNGMLAKMNGGKLPATYAEAWALVMKELVGPARDWMRNKDYTALNHGGARPLRVPGGVKDVHKVGIPVAAFDAQGKEIDLSSFMDGAGVGSSEERSSLSTSLGREVYGDKSHKLGDGYFGKHNTQFKIEGSAAPGSPMHSFVETVFSKAGDLDYIKGLGAVKSGLKDEDRELIRRGEKPASENVSFKDVKIGDRTIRLAVLEVAFESRAAAELSSTTDLYTRAITNPVLKDPALLNPSVEGDRIARADERCRTVGLGLHLALNKALGTDVTPEEMVELIEDPFLRKLASDLADKGISPETCLYTLQKVAPKLISRLKKAAAVVTTGGKFTLVDSGMWVDKSGAVRSITGELDPFITGQEDYRVENGRIYGAMFRGNITGENTRLGSFVKAEDLTQWKADVVQYVMAMRGIQKATESGNKSQPDERLDELKQSILDRMVYSHGKGGPKDHSTLLDDLVTEDGQFDESAIRTSPGINKVAEAAGVAGASYIAGMRMTSLSRVPGVVMSSHRFGVRLSEPISWVERSVTYKKPIWEADENGIRRRKMTMVTETMFAPGLANEIALSPEFMVPAGEDLDGDAVYLAAKTRDPVTGVPLSAERFLGSDDPVDAMAKSIQNRLEKDVFAKDKKKYGGSLDSLTPIQRENRRRALRRELDSMRGAVSNGLLDDLTAAAVQGLTEERGRMTPTIDVAAIRNTAEIPLLDRASRERFVKDEASMQELRKVMSKAGIPADVQERQIRLLTETVFNSEDPAVLSLNPVAAMEVMLGPVSERKSHDGVLAKTSAAKYAGTVRGIFAASARVLSTAITAKASFVAGKPRWKTNDDGTLELADERGTEGPGNAVTPLRNGILFGADLAPVDGLVTAEHDGNYTGENLRSLAYSIQFLADNLNTIIDTEKQKYNETVGYLLIPELYQVELALSLTQKFKNYDEAKAFHKKIMEWGRTPMGRAVVEESLSKKRYDRNEYRRMFHRGRMEMDNYERPTKNDTNLTLSSVADRIFERQVRYVLSVHPATRDIIKEAKTSGNGSRRAIAAAVNGRAKNNPAVRRALAEANDIAERFRQASGIFSDFQELDRKASQIRNPAFSADAFAKATRTATSVPRFVTFRNRDLVMAIRDGMRLAVNAAGDIHSGNPLLRRGSKEQPSFGDYLQEATGKAEARKATAGEGAVVPVMDYGSREYYEAFLSANSAVWSMSPEVRNLVSGEDTSKIVDLTHRVAQAIWEDLKSRNQTNAAVSRLLIPAEGATVFRYLGRTKEAIDPNDLWAIHNAVRTMPSVIVDGVTFGARDTALLLAAYSSVLYGARFGSQGSVLDMVPVELLAEMVQRQHSFVNESGGELLQGVADSLAQRFVDKTYKDKKLKSELRHRVFSMPVLGSAAFGAAVPLPRVTKIEVQEPSAPTAAARVEAPTALRDEMIALAVPSNAEEMGTAESVRAVRDFFTYVKDIPAEFYPAGKVTAAVQVAAWNTIKTKIGDSDKGMAEQVQAILRDAAAGMNLTPSARAAANNEIAKALGTDKFQTLLKNHPWFVPFVMELSAVSGKTERLSFMKRAVERAQTLADQAYTTTAPVAPPPEGRVEVGFKVDTRPGVPQAEREKAPYKAGLASKYIGFGGRSTGMYREQAINQRIPVNQENYQRGDVVFVSVNGSPSESDLKKTIDMAKRALDAGAVLLTDSAEYLKASSYNEGERKLAEALLAAGYLRNADPGMPLLVARWSKATETPAAQATPTAPAGEISSDSKGLNAALTNPTELAKRKGNLTQSYPVKVRDTEYQDAEAAFQALKPKERMDKAAYDAQTDALMREILVAKFLQHKHLAHSVHDKGGVAWLESASHRASDKNWGGVGRGSRFIAALSDAYKTAVGPQWIQQEEDFVATGKEGGSVEVSYDLMSESWIAKTVDGEKIAVVTDAQADKYRARATFSALSQKPDLSGDEYVSPLAAYKLHADENWNTVADQVLDRMGVPNNEARDYYRDLIDKQLAPYRQANSFAEARIRETTDRATGNLLLGDLLDRVGMLIKYRQPADWMRATVAAAAENPAHPYNRWTAIQAALAKIGDDGLVDKMDAAYNELVLRDERYAGAADALERDLGMPSGAAPVEYSPVPPPDAVVHQPSSKLLNLIATDDKLSKHMRPEDVRPVVADRTKYHISAADEARVRAAVDAMEPKNIKPFGGDAPKLTFSAEHTPLDAGREGDVLAGWPNGKIPLWRTITFADPQVMFQAEQEVFSRLRGKNERLEILQRYAQRGGVHKARTDRLKGRILRLFGMDHQGQIRRMTKSTVRQVSGGAGLDLFAGLDEEQRIEKQMGGGAEIMFDDKGEGWDFSLVAVARGLEDGRIRKIGAADVFTDDELREVQTFLAAIHMDMQGEEHILTGVRTSTEFRDGLQTDKTYNALRASLPSALAEHVIDVIKKSSGIPDLINQGYALSTNPETSGISETIVTIPIKGILEDFKTLPSYKKLVDSGRPEEYLKPEYVKNMIRKFFDTEREEINREMPWFMSEEGDPVRYRKNYVPMEFGTGWYAKSVENVDAALEKDINAELNERARKSEESLDKTLQHGMRLEGGEFTVKSLDDVTPKMLQYLHKLLHKRAKADVTWSGEDLFRASIRTGVYAGQGLPADADYLTVARLIHELTMQELFRRKMEAADLHKELEEGDGIDPVAMVRILRKQLRGMPSEEPSYLRRRVYNNYREAWENGGLLPTSSNIVDLISRYGEKQMEHTARKLSLNSLLLCTDVDGKPLVTALPNLDYEDHGVIEDATWESAARLWAAYYETPYDESQTGKQNAHRIVTANVVGQSTTSAIETVRRRFNWTVVPTDYASVSAWYGAMGEPGESGILTLAGGGESATILKQLMDSTKYSNTYRALSVINDVNSWTKSIAMQFSLFHPVAIFEDMIAGTAGKTMLPRKILDVFKTKGWAANHLTPMEIYHMMKTDSAYLAYLRTLMEQVGITWCYGNSNAQDIGFERMQGQIGKIAQYVQEKAGSTAAQNAREVMDILTQEQSSFVFEYCNNIGKIAVVHGLLMEARAQAIKAGKAFDPVASLRPMSQMINEAVGGLNPTQYAWYTPQVRQIGNLLLFSLQWTMGAWNAAGGAMLTGKLFDTRLTPEARDFVLKRRIPVMLGIVLFLGPAVFQAALYSIAKMAGGAGDPDDTPWSWENEDGKISAVDATPILRMLPGYEGGTTGKRRTYLRWGKQLHEIVSWFSDPTKTLIGKTSLPLQTVWAEVTGTSPGTDIAMGFKDQGVMGVFAGKNGFSDGRLWHVMQRAVPGAGTFSLGSYLRNPDASIAVLFASVSRGTSFRAASDNAQEILRAWAENDSYLLLRKDQKKRADLESLLADVLDAAKRNGYPPDKVLNSAIAAVTKQSYEKFYFALDKGDKAGMDEAAHELMRLNGTVDKLRGSVRNRNNLYGKPMKLTGEQRAAIQAAFNVTEAQMAKADKKEEIRERHKKPTFSKQIADLNDYARKLVKAEKGSE